MILVKTYLDKSAIHGLGLFAGENLRKGTMVWMFHPVCDRRVPAAKVDALPEPARSSIRHGAYRENGFYVMSGDNTRFINHSDTPNLKCTCLNEDVFIAARDIAMGEELTEDYRGFDELFAERALG